MKMSNRDMDDAVQSLTSIGEKVTGKLGYAVAKNLRKINNELIEYRDIKNRLIVEHGEKQENGNYILSVGTDKYYDYLKELDDYANIEHEVDIYKISSEEVITSSLNALEIAGIDFMIEDAE